MSIIDIQVQDRADPSKMVTLKRYAVNPKEEPTAVLFGKFSPFTGKLGHGRMLTFAKTHGIKTFAIVSPLRDETKETDSNMFNSAQRLEIAIAGAKDMKFNVQAFNINSTNPLGMFREVATKIDRPVFIVGPDRKAQFEKMFITFNKSNKAITDATDKDFGKGEMLAMTERGENNTSGTKVRQALKDQNEEEFIKLTGYSKVMYEYMISILKSNHIVESYYHMANLFC